MIPHSSLGLFIMYINKNKLQFMIVLLCVQVITLNNLLKVIDRLSRIWFSRLDEFCEVRTCKKMEIYTCR